MKQCKTLLSIVMAIMMLLTMMIPTLAAQEGKLEGGSITINNAVVGQTYNAYQILYLESYNATSGAYAYKANSAWSTFVNSDAIKGVYLNVDDDGYVTWVPTLVCVEEVHKHDASCGEGPVYTCEKTEHTHGTACYENQGAAEFAKLAEAYAKTNSIANDGSQKATTTTVTFTGLKLGYYLVTTSLGTLCSLDTTNPTVTIQEKNGVPTNEKKVEEDSTPGVYGSSNDADIGQTVKFQSTITAQAGAENYVFHDKMSAGLTYTGITGITLNGNTVATTNYTVKTADLTDDCTFEVVFTQEFCDTLKANDQIVIFYTATVNDEAVVGLTGNPNESKLEYGEKGSSTVTPPSTTTTYTWELNVLKYANGDESKVLADAEFVLLNKDLTKVAKFDTNGKLTGWETVPTVADDGTITWPENTTLTTDDQGKIRIEGLDGDTYYLRETKAPAGYNKLKNDIKVEITKTTTNGTVKVEYKQDGVTSDGTIKVNNQSGTELPSTGGIGTTIFYCVGATLALGAFVLLVTKKRMGRE